MKEDPWLSVIIPVYNGQNYLRQALDSVVSQNMPCIECIVIDDNSSDNTVNILEEYKALLKITIISHQENKGWVYCSNEGLQHAKGEFVCFLHHDDIWEENRLITMKQYTESYVDIDFFVHNAIFIDYKGKKLGHWKCPFGSKSKQVSSEQFKNALLIQNFIAIPSPIIRRELAANIGGFDEKYWYTADWEFWLQAVSSSDVFVCVESLASFRVHPLSQTIKRSTNIADFRSQMEQVLQRHLDNSVEYHIKRAAKISVETNVFLASIVHRKPVGLVRYVTLVFSSGFRSIKAYLQYSCIVKRIWVRCKASLFV